MDRKLVGESKKSRILTALEDADVSISFEDALESKMVLNMGPQHPATHGVLRLLIRLDGETVVGIVPDLGYLHRGYEKIAENCSYHEYIPHTDRLDYLSPLANNVAYVLAVEKLAGIEVPVRAQYIRVIGAELARVASHLVWLGSMSMDIGAVTVLLWTFREREKILDILEILTGARFTVSYARVGGLAQDMTEECARRVEEFIEQLPQHLEEVEGLLCRNRIFIDRTEKIGYLSREDAIALGVTGPILRASGVAHDLRKDSPYLIYDQLEFDVPSFPDGDSLSRFYVRLIELKESARIVRQCLHKIPSGPIRTGDSKKMIPLKEKVYTRMEELINDFMVVNFGINPPVGEAYHAIEGSKGELGFHIVSDGSGNPWRLKIRAPSFVNLQSLPLMAKGQMVSDVVAIIGSVDPVMGEADK
ncbi:MAG: NADH dehydrogenase (quinone) subunit D [Bacteroidota bacterium]